MSRHDDDTLPSLDVTAERRDHISSQSELDSAAILLGQLERHAGDAEASRSAVRRALASAVERGQLMERTHRAGVESDLARERSLRRELSARLLDIRAALLRYEAGEDPEAYGRLRLAIMDPTPRPETLR